MQGNATVQQQFPQGAESTYLPPAAMCGDAPSLQSESSLSQMSSVPSLQQMLASGQVDERLLSTLQGLTARNPGAPGLPGSLGTAQGMGLGRQLVLGSPSWARSTSSRASAGSWPRALRARAGPRRQAAYHGRT